MKDIVVLAGTTPWSVLSLCKTAYDYKRKAYVVCVNFEGKMYEQSKYVSRTFSVKETEFEDFISQFHLVYNLEEKPILYFTNDATCLLGDKYRALLNEYFDVLLPSRYILSSFLDKNIASIEAEKNGLTVPKTIEICSSGDVAFVLENFTFPVILKPVSANDDSCVGFKTRICGSTDLPEITKPILDFGKHVVCQEYIPGNDSDYKFYMFYRNKEGKIKKCIGEKTLQSNGIMTIGTVKGDKCLSELSKKFLDRIDYVGIGGLEFKKYGDKYYFIEMSTRTEGFLPISDMSNVSIAEASFLDCNRERVDWENAQINNVKYIVFFSWMFHRLSDKQFFSMLKDLMSFVKCRKCYFTETYVGVFWYYFFYYFSKIRRSINLLFAK